MRTDGINSASMILEDTSATGMGFDRGGTAVIGSLLVSTHFQYAY
jgi:hypothetical protein